MDIINRGDFAVSNVNGKTTFTFRMPSLKETDYVSEINGKRIFADKRTPAKKSLCPCGSGKLYRDCHGKTGK